MWQAFGGTGTVRSAHVFGNRLYSVPLLSKEEIKQHIDWETSAVHGPGRSPTQRRHGASKGSAAQVLDAGVDDHNDTAIVAVGGHKWRRKKLGRPSKDKLTLVCTRWHHAASIHNALFYYCANE